VQRQRQVHPLKNTQIPIGFEFVLQRCQLIVGKRRSKAITTVMYIKKHLPGSPFFDRLFDAITAGIGLLINLHTVLFPCFQ
jgi:hypothetical protein